MQKKTCWSMTFALVVFCVVVQSLLNESVYSQGRGNVTPEVIARRNANRNLNSGGRNYDETKGVVAHNAVHHSKQYPLEEIAKK